MPNEATKAVRQPASAVLFLYSETPVHAGTGSGKAGLDQPIQRSVLTKYPTIYDSSLRGSLRRLSPDKPSEDLWFGRQDSEGILTTPDCELLLFPVGSAHGIVAWVTCEAALKHFARRMELYSSSFREDQAKAVNEFQKN